MTSTGQSVPAGSATMGFSRGALLIFLSWLIAFTTDEAYTCEVCPGKMTEDPLTDEPDCIANNGDTAMSLTGMMQSLEILTQTLFGSQYEAAKLFEVAYYSVSNFPDVAVQVRLSAHQARTSHELSVNLMKKFSSTSRQMVGQVFPLIMEAATTGKGNIVKEHFDIIIKWSRNMEIEAEHARKGYADLQKQLQEDIETIRKENESVEREQETIKEEKKQQESLLEKDKKDEKKWIEKEEEAEKGLKGLKERQEAITKQLEEGRKAGMKLMEIPDEGRNAGMKFLELAITPEFYLDKVTAGYKYVVHLANFNTNMETLKATEKSIGQSNEEHFTVLKERQHQMEKVAERYRTIKSLFLRDELLGDERTLIEAVSRLGQADQSLGKIAKFWSNMGTLLNQLKNQADLGEPYLNDISDPAIQEIFSRIMDKAKGNWEIFSTICEAYVTHSERDPTASITATYAFLDGRVDKMSPEQRKKKIEQLQNDLISRLTTPAITEG